MTLSRVGRFVSSRVWGRIALSSAARAPPVPFAVILDLDRHSAAALAPISEAVERADADAMTPHRSTIEPHITLAVYDHLDAAAMTMVLRHFAEGLPAVPVRLSSLSLFPAASSVLFAAPVVSAEILALHRAYHEAAWSVIASCWAHHYLPDQWVPHVTLGEGLTAAVLARSSSTPSAPGGRSTDI